MKSRNQLVEKEEKHYTNVNEIQEELEKMLANPPKDMRSREYKEYKKKYTELAELFNYFWGFKAMKTTI